MNKIKLPLVFLLLLTLNITNVKSQTKTDSIIQVPNEAVIAVDKMNILYIGIENPITVAVPNVNSEDITLKCSDGADVRMVSFGHYVAVVYKSAYEVTITTLVKGVVKGSSVFKVRSVSMPFAMFGTRITGKISLDEVPFQSIIWVGQGPGFLISDLKYTVTKYTLTYTTKTKDVKGRDSIGTVTYTEMGAAISTRIKEAMKNVKVGDKITVFDIEAMGPGGIGLLKLDDRILLDVK